MISTAILESDDPDMFVIGTGLFDLIDCSWPETRKRQFIEQSAELHSAYAVFVAEPERAKNSI